MKNWIAKLPIKSKLMLIVMLTSITGLVLAGIIIIAYDGYRGKKEMLQDLSSIALLIADRSTAALAFDDSRLAEENLAALRVKPFVTSACIFNETGEVFARYSAAEIKSVQNAGDHADTSGISFAPLLVKTESWHSFEQNSLTIIEPVILNEKLVGAVYIKASLDDLYSRSQNTMLFIAAIILLSSIVAFFLSLWLQRLISGPLTHLTRTAQHIAIEKDYSVRAVKTSDDETGVLVTAFNEMLETIDSQNKSNEQYRLRQEELIREQQRDIVERKQAQKSLKESEDRYRAIFENVTVGIFQSSKEGRMIIANPAFAKILGFDSPDELINAVQNVSYDLYANHEKYGELNDIIARQGFVNNYELAAFKKNKDIISVALTKRSVKDDHGNILFYEGTIEDITMKKRFSELKSAMNIAQLGYWEYDVASDLFTFNDEFFSIFHANAEKAGGYELSLARYAEQFCHPDGREALKTEITKAVETKDSHYSSQLEQQIVYSDSGETGYIHYLIFIVKNSEGLTVKIYGAVQDITKTKKQIVELEAAKETAERATRSKSEFLAKMSHEIRTPLGAVIGLNNLLDKTALDKKQKDYVTKIKNSAGYLLQVINDVLDFTKIESGKMELENILFSLENILEDIGDFSSIKSMGKNVEIIIDKDPEVPPLLIGDPLRLKQVLLNLMNNAIKFTDKGSIILKVKFCSVVAGKIEMDFSVSDTGIGMTELQIENLFQAYSQADSTTTRKYGGTGLGLNICYKFIDMMGGRLSVKSEFGKGSIFYFTLPFDAPDAKTNAVARKIPETIKNMRILIADDSAMFRKVIEKYIKRLGLSCYQAESGNKTVDALKEQPFDVLFIDCNLPEMNGFDTIKKIMGDASIVKKPKVVFVTTLSNDTVLKEMEATGIKNILFKPLNESVIFNTIVNLFSSEDRDMVRKKIGQNFYPQNFDKIRGAKILVAEDNEINQQIIREILENHQFEVIMAPDGRRCVEIYKNEKDIDLILMDIQMPEMDGIEATKFIRNELKDENIKIIALTADVIHETRERINTSGMNDFISKPIDETELFRALVRWIDPSNIKNAEGKTPKKITGSEYANAVISEERDTCEIIYSEGIRRVTGNEKLYRELIGKFIANNKELAAELEKYIQNREYSSLAKRIHNFKGVSANLGLKAASALAAEIQAAADTCSESAFSLISNLDNSLKTTFTELQKYLDDTKKIEEPGRKGEYDFLIELKRMLENDEMAARDLFADGRDEFGIGEKDEYSGLSSAIDIYDFETAKKELNILIERKKESANG